MVKQLAKELMDQLKVLSQSRKIHEQQYYSSKRFEKELDRTALCKVYSVNGWTKLL